MSTEHWIQEESYNPFNTFLDFKLVSSNCRGKINVEEVAFELKFNCSVELTKIFYVFVFIKLLTQI